MRIGLAVPLAVLLTVLLTGAALTAQQADKQGEEHVPLPPGLVIPPSPVVAPELALRTLHCAPGFHAELAAAEPLVEDPVAIAFDADARMWVVEMRSFMPDIDGTGETAPTGCIAVLTDTDGDGVYDRRTTFMDQLVLPRAVLPVQGGALVIEPPSLLFCADADGDLVAESKTVVAAGFDAGISNPEHAANGLLWGLDNWIHLANHPFRYRRTAAGFVSAPAAGHGQWGLSQDDRGRLYFDYNEDWLRTDLVPGFYTVRNPDAGTAAAGNYRLAKDTSVWPIRITPGVNRGYRRGILKDATLMNHTAACGPGVYRGELQALGLGDVYACDPAANVVRRFHVQHGESPSADNACERAEFLASTDERFRPVNVTTGPDGALYVVDMYRGVIQHRNFVTSYLRHQVKSRQLERPLGLGRIWRVLPDGVPRRAPPRLSAAGTVELVLALQCDNGELRDRAQQLLVERHDRDAIEPLRALLRHGADPRARLHALWTLDGLAVLDRIDVLAALRDADDGVRCGGVRLSEPLLSRGDFAASVLCADLHSAPCEVRWQLAASYGEVTGKGEDDALTALASLAAQHAPDPILRSTAVSSVGGRELRLLTALRAAATFDQEAPGRAALFAALARSSCKHRDADAQQQLFTFAGACMAVWQQRALLQGAVDALPQGELRDQYFVFAETPLALASMARSGDAAVGRLVQTILASILIRVDVPEVQQLSPQQRALVTHGARLYGFTCASCHQGHGRGMAGLAPPLRESEWVQGPAARMVRIALCGVRGEIEVNGQTWNLEMPSHDKLADGDLAAILSYVRQQFGNGSSLVEPAAVTAARAALGGRKDQFTPAELLQVK